MESKRFLKDGLFKLSQKFPRVQVRYFFDAEIDTHIIELTPENEYYNNTELDKEWIPISLEFMKTFPEESISFVSSDSVLSPKEAEYSCNLKTEHLVNIEKMYELILNSQQQLEIPSGINWLLSNSFDDFVFNPEHIDWHYNESKRLFARVLDKDLVSNGNTKSYVDDSVLIAEAA